MLGTAITTLTAIVACAIPGCSAIDTNPAPTVTPCEAAADGIVWQFYTDDDFGCDVMPGQILGLTGTPGQQECDDMGGTYTAYTDTTDDGWDDAAYGDCVNVDF